MRKNQKAKSGRHVNSRTSRWARRRPEVEKTVEQRDAPTSPAACVAAHAGEPVAAPYIAPPPDGPWPTQAAPAIPTVAVQPIKAQ
uniref:Uncharacterized protein n=1 Tax=Oryza sativa subsp. japonica TaxID=39947 RepID=Q6ZDZ1_ORYSJ|nr:hypothetical protein [Oryza sativa Japonica Group]